MAQIRVYSPSYDSFTIDLDLMDRRLFLWYNLENDEHFVSWDKYGGRDEQAAFQGIVRKIQDMDGCIRYPDHTDLAILDRFNLGRRNKEEIIASLDEPQKQRKIDNDKELESAIYEGINNIEFMKKRNPSMFD